LMNVDNGGHNFAVVQPVHEILHTGFDDGLGLHDRSATGVGAALHHAAQIVDRIKVNVIKAPDFGFDVAGHGQVDHDHGLMTANTRSALDHAQAQNGQGACRTGHNDVEV